MKLLAILVGAKSAPACLDAAAAAARTLGGSSIEALNIVVDPEHIIAPSEEIASRLGFEPHDTAPLIAELTH